jgi:hypothetical protein
MPVPAHRNAAPGWSSPPSRRRPLAGLAVLLGLGGSLAAGGVAGAAARPQASGSVNGTVVSVDRSAGSFVLRTTTGARLTVKVTGSTTYNESGVAKPTFSDVQVGDSVAVIGSTSSGVDTASVVIIGHKVSGASGAAGSGGGSGPGGPGGGFGGFGRGGVFGRVTAVDSSKHTFVLQTFNGSKVTVRVTGSTTYRDRAISTAAGFSDVKVGETVAVQGSSSNGTETATSVLILGAGGGFGLGGPGGGFGGGTVGRVTSVDSSKGTFVLRTFTGSTVTVRVTGSTTYRDPAATRPGFSDVKVGETVSVRGTTSGGVETATSIVIGGAGGRGGLGGPSGGTVGKVSSVDSNRRSFELKTAAGATVTVEVTAKTIYRDSSVAKAGFSDIKVGENVAVIGSTTKGVETASTVIIGFTGFTPHPSGSGSSSTSTT